MQIHSTNSPTNPSPKPSFHLPTQKPPHRPTHENRIKNSNFSGDLLYEPGHIGHVYIYIYTYKYDESSLNRSKRLFGRHTCPALLNPCCSCNNLPVRAGSVMSHALASRAVPRPVAQKAQLYQFARQKYACTLVRKLITIPTFS